MILHSFPTFNLTKILYVAEELGIAYQLHLMTAMSGEHMQPEHQARHPMGKVPVLELDGHFYFESNAICRLLCEIENNQLYGKTAQERAVCNQWVDFVSMSIGPHLQVYAWEEVVKQFARNDSNPNQDKLAAASKAMSPLLDCLNKQLGNQAFICGDALTFADYIAFALFEITTFTSVSISAYPSLQRWFEHLNSQPAVEAAKQKLPNSAIFEFLGK